MSQAAGGAAAVTLPHRNHLITPVERPVWKCDRVQDMAFDRMARVPQIHMEF